MGKISLKKVEPFIGLPGGIVKIFGKGFQPWQIQNENINFCESSPWIEGVSDGIVITSIPYKIYSGDVYIEINGNKSNKLSFVIPEIVATGVHLVDSPVIDEKGNIYATYSGSRGENTPVSIYKITPYGEKIVYLQGLTNATSLAIDKKGILFIASRFNGKIYKSKEEQEYELYSQGLGVAFGLALDSGNNLYAGDRGGSIFKISEDGRAEYFVSIPQSYISFHLGFDSKDHLYISNPIHMGENFIYKIDQSGKIDVFFSGYSMFHGFCFDKEDNMYVSEAKRNESRILKISQKGECSVIASGANFIGATFDNKGDLIICSSNSIYRIKKEYIE